MRKDPIGLPGLSEPEALRHYVRLSQKNHAIDLALYPLGSCTMKHNPRLNEKMARLPGFGDVHPLQPQSVQGAIELMDRLAHWLKTLTGMPAVALSPKAGAHGELCGLLAIHAAHDAKGDHARRVVVVPTSAHGTNPHRRLLRGPFRTRAAQTPDGRVDLKDLEAKLDPRGRDHGHQPQYLRPVRTRRDRGSRVWRISCGRLLLLRRRLPNAIVGRVRPGDLGVDAMHINLHKTFSTPHGGGGPGAGPVVLSEALAPFAPVPWVMHDKDGFHLVEEERDAAAKSFGRMCAFQGQMGMHVRAPANDEPRFSTACARSPRTRC